jgi:hypothetical protein
MPPWLRTPVLTRLHVTLNTLAVTIHLTIANITGPYGENLEAGESTIAAAVALWYDEESQYNFQAGQYSVISLRIFANM